MPSPDPEHAPLVGLLAAQVAEIRELPNKRATRQSIVGPGKVNLGTPLVDTDGILHLLDLDRLLPDTVRALLSDLPSGEA
jgi:chemotaxis signal transduction protein